MGNGESSLDDEYVQEPTQSYAGSSYPMGDDHHVHGNRQHRKHHPKFIADNFGSLDEVISALREAGLESSNLILGIDFTKSNEWTGRYSFHRKSLHAIGSTPNPYEQAISVIGRTLSPFDEDNLIPCFGFGDASTHEKYVFSFYPDHRPCQGFEEVLARYREIVPYLKLSGPTSFAPIIDAAIDIVDKSNGQYHVLVIIADGQVTRSPGTPPGSYSHQELETVNSIVAASHYPLSIVLVGVGDGPWDAMQQFDDNFPQRAFDNFQKTYVDMDVYTDQELRMLKSPESVLSTFISKRVNVNMLSLLETNNFRLAVKTYAEPLSNFVNFTKIMSESKEASKKETSFALAALMEIPFQYKATLALSGAHRDGAPRTRPLPPPSEVIDHDNAVKQVPQMIKFETVEPASAAVAEPVCPICLTNPKDMAFGCGHMTCKECAATITMCPLCREPIKQRLRLYT